MRTCRPGKWSAALDESRETGASSIMAAVTILKSDERSTGPSLGTNSNTVPARGRVVPVKWLVRLCHCKVPARMDHVAEIAVLERVMVSAFWAACTLGSGAACAHP